VTGWRRKFACSVCALLAYEFFSSPLAISDLRPVGSSLRNGDVILLEGRSLRSKLVRLFNENGNEFSHIGLIEVTDGGLFVIHADPVAGKVISEPLEQVTRSEVTAQARFLRNENLTAQQTEAIVSEARRISAAGVPFDHGFRWHTPESLYCTEFVARAYEKIGLTLFPDVKDYVLPSDFLQLSSFAVVR
jgi:hypothetical protein